MKIFDRTLKPNMTEELVEVVCSKIFPSLADVEKHKDYTPPNSIDQFWKWWSQGEESGYCHSFNKEINALKELLVNCNVIPTSHKHETIMEMTKYLNVISRFLGNPKIDIICPTSERTEAVHHRINDHHYVIAMINYDVLEIINQFFCDRNSKEAWKTILETYQELFYTEHPVKAKTKDIIEFLTKTKEIPDEIVNDIYDRVIFSVDPTKEKPEFFNPESFSLRESIQEYIKATGTTK